MLSDVGNIQIDYSKVGPFLIQKPKLEELFRFHSTLLKKQILERLNCSACKAFILDLSQVRYIDSGSMAMLVHIALIVRSHSKTELVLITANKTIMKTLTLTNIDQLCRLFTTREEALETLLQEQKTKELVYLGTSEKVKNWLQDETPNEMLFHAFSSLKSLKKSVLYDCMVLFIDYSMVGLLLIRSIRQIKGFQKCMIIALTNIDEQNKYFTYGVDFLLPFPSTKDQARSLLEEVFRSQSADYQQKSRVPSSFLNQYVKSIPDKIQTLRKLVKDLEESGQTKNIDLLINNSHNIVGSAGTYGFFKASQACKNFIAFLKEDHASAVFDEKYIQKCHEHITSIQFYFQSILHPDLSLSHKALSSIAEQKIFLISRDQMFIDAFQKAASELKLILCYFNSAMKAIDSLQVLDSRPKLMVLDYEDGKTDIVHQFYKEFQRVFSLNNVKVWAAFENDTLESRVNILKEGIEFHLHKPLSSLDIQQLLENHLLEKKTQEYKVLAVDDDQEIIHLYEHILKELPIQLTCLTSGETILDTLSKIEPDLMILDINLPNYDGWTILETLRHDNRYLQMRVLIVSGTALEQSNNKSMIKSMRYTETVQKPFKKEMLKNKVIKILHEIKEQKNAIAFFQPTVHTREAFEATLKTILKFEREKSYHLAIIKSLDFNTIKDPIKQKKFLIEADILLSKSFGEEYLVGYLEEGLFAIFFGFNDQQKAETFLHRFINVSEYKISFQTGYATFSTLFIPSIEPNIALHQFINSAIGYFNTHVIHDSDAKVVSPSTLQE